MQKLTLCAAVAAGFLTAILARGQCRMTYSVSVYSDGAVSSDYSAVYGYSSSIDNSILCGCGHGGYQSTTTVYPPYGDSYASTQSGMISSVYAPTNGRFGTYTVTGRITLLCSCAGLVAAGGLAANLYACPFPAGEVSNPQSWYLSADYIGAIFMMDLKDAGNSDPPPSQYKDRVITEELSDLVDGCRYPGSDGPLLKQPDPGPPWTVTSLNKYGGDLIANPIVWVRYYQQAIADGRAPYQSCVQTDTQKMWINGCGGGSERQYHTNQIRVIVEKDRVTVVRGNGQLSGN